MGMSGRDNNSYLPGNPSWNMHFPFAVWFIWKRKNQVMFSRKALNPKLASEIVNQTLEFMHYVHLPRNPIHKVERIRWERLPQGWMKFNTDGSSIGNLGLASCWGIVRDNQGRWILGFLGTLGQLVVLWLNCGALGMG